MKARSELVMPLKLAGGGVFDTTRRFHDASAASIRPARRPTRGSGLGAAMDMSAVGAMVPLLEDMVADAHPAAATRVRLSDRFNKEVRLGMWSVAKGGGHGAVMPRVRKASIFSMRAISVD